MSPKFRPFRRGRYLFFPLIAAGFLLLMGVAVMLLWNAVLPELVAVNRITYWQAVGLLLLCRILFGNFRKPAPWPRGGHHPKHRHWREKWRQMSPEEREKMKEKWKRWWDKD